METRAPFIKNGMWGGFVGWVGTLGHAGIWGSVPKKTRDQRSDEMSCGCRFRSPKFRNDYG